ncbi:unnamed protein product [Macrosiphum euphorbiae]|uniref:Reverse transcriptase domain-containing protein n=1 Tax=Macrosiphum euphorbiae TaxID=13131 RepID=A0AAV0WP13_9HEMI|nr:unnamed protein product [Macrosiphum euphorbiae]
MTKVLEIIILIQSKKVISTSIQPDLNAFRLQSTTLYDQSTDESHRPPSLHKNREDRTAAVFLDFEKAFDSVTLRITAKTTPAIRTTIAGQPGIIIYFKQDILGPRRLRLLITKNIDCRLPYYVYRLFCSYHT